MTSADLIVSLVSGAAAGALVTSVVSATSTRTERFRDRMVDAADSFLGALDSAIAANDAVSDVVSEVRSVHARFTSAVDEAGEVFSGDTMSTGLVLKAQQLVEAVQDAVKSTGTEDDHLRAHELARELRVEAAGDVPELHASPERLAAARELAEATSRFAPAVELMGRRERLFFRELHLLGARLARIQIVFADKDDAVSPAAGKCVFAVAALNQELGVAEIFLGEPPPEPPKRDQDDADGQGESGVPRPELLAQEFAKEVNRRIRRRFL